mmetsp:Transcript_62805/g.182177  ORF Transcript_62805/g.182177 Transcript_62805/m.182177 type:complete len:119 (-) Transcript_62805:74-430(-)
MTSLQGKIMQTVADEVAHTKKMDARFADLNKVESEVKYIGQDAYVPRLVASNVPIVRPRQEGVAGAPAQDALTYRPSYAEKPTSNRPAFQRNTGGVPAIRTHMDAEPHVFPRSTLTGV